jgi:tRNA (guanine9-N1)-methyltransferase
VIVKAAMTTDPQAQTEASASTLPLGDVADAVAAQTHLSKNAQKKLARAARIAEQKKERRVYEKEKKKEKRRELAAKRAAGELDEGEEGGPKKKVRVEGPRTPFNARVVVDLSFDDMMTDNVSESISCITALELKKSGVLYRKSSL